MKPQATNRVLYAATVVAIGALFTAAIGVTAAFVVAPPAAPPVAAHASSPLAKSPPRATAANPVPATTAPDRYIIKRTLVVDHQLRHGDWLWDETSAPAIGEVVVMVDLKAQMMSVLRDGYEIGLAVIEHGADDKPTPLGTFPILGKDARHRSSLYVGPDGRPAPMNWALRLTPDGVFIHAAEVRRNWGSNGCIGVPDAFAKRLFDTASRGDVVVVTNGRTMREGEALGTSG